MLSKFTLALVMVTAAAADSAQVLDLRASARELKQPNGQPFTHLQHQIDDILETLEELEPPCKPSLNFFSANEETITVPDDSNAEGQNILLYDLCVPAGSSVELMAQASLRFEVEEVCLTFYLDGEKVAEGCSDDFEEPSSMSTFFKGTVAEDTLVELKIGNREDDDILPFNLQFGAKVFDDCYVGVVNTIPEAF